MEIKQLHDEMLRTHNDFKSYVERELTEVKKSGVAAPETKAALEKMNTRMSELESQIKARLDEIQAKAERPGSDEHKDGLTAEQREYKSALLQYVRKGRDAGLGELEQKAMSVGSDPDGGYTVTPDMSGRIVTKIFETTPMLQIASVQNISTDALEGLEDRDEVSVGWVGETATRSETDTPELGKWRIPVHEMYAEPRATQKLLDDSAVDIASWLENKISEKFSRVQNDAYVNGSGVGKPRGFTTYTTAATADGSRTWGQLEHVLSGASADFASSNPADKIFDLIYAMKGAYRASARFMMPRAVIGKIRKFKESTTNAYIWQPGLQAGEPARLLGYPVTESEDMPALAANSLSLAFGDFRRGYQIVTRQGIRVLRDPYTAKPYVKFYTTARVGGGVIDFDAIKFLKFNT